MDTRKSDGQYTAEIIQKVASERRRADSVMSTFPVADETEKSAIRKLEDFFINVEAKHLADGSSYLLSSEESGYLIEHLTMRKADDPSADLTDRILPNADDLRNWHWDSERCQGEGSNKYRSAISSLSAAYLQAMHPEEPTAEFATEQYFEQVRAAQSKETQADEAAHAFAKLTHRIAYEMRHPPEQTQSRGA